MSDYQIQNVRYSLISNLYEKNSRFIDNLTNQSNAVEDKVSVGITKGDIHVEGVETQLSNQPDILSEGDQIAHNRTSTGFLNLIKQKFFAIKTSEEVSINNQNAKSNLVEMSASITEAEISLQQIIAVRDKLVHGYKEILNSAF